MLTKPVMQNKPAQACKKKQPLYSYAEFDLVEKDFITDVKSKLTKPENGPGQQLARSWKNVHSRLYHKLRVEINNIGLNKKWLHPAIKDMKKKLKNVK